MAHEFEARHPTSFLRANGISMEKSIKAVGLGDLSTERFEELSTMVTGMLKLPVGYIHAIKEVRARTNCSLKDAKLFVDSFR